MNVQSSIVENVNTIDNNNDVKNINKKETEQKSNNIFEEGRYITGEIVEVTKENVLVKFNNNKIMFEKEVFGNVSKGEKKDFEVIKVTKEQIILKQVHKAENKEGAARQIARTYIETSSLNNVDKEESIQKEKKDIQIKIQSESNVKKQMDKFEKTVILLSSEDIEELENQGKNIVDMNIDDLQENLKIIHINKKYITQTTDKKNNDSGIVDKIGDKTKNSIENNTQKLENVDNSKKNNKIQKKQQETTKEIEDNILTEKIKEKLNSYGIQLSDNTIKEIEEAFKISKIISEKSKLYIIEQQKEPTIENLYKATYITSNGKNTNYCNQVSINDEELLKIEGQIKDIIKKSGRNVDNYTLEQAKWLIKNGIALTNDNLTRFDDLEKVTSYTDEEIIDKLVQGVAKGEDVIKVNLLTKAMGEIEDNIETVLKKIDSISDNAIEKVLQEEDIITIEKLVKKQEELVDVKQEEIKEEIKEQDNEILHRTHKSIGKYIDQQEMGDKLYTKDYSQNRHSKTEMAAKKSKDVDKILEQRLYTNKDVTKEYSKLKQQEKIYDVQEQGLKDIDIEVVKARRQLEEIRLKMTLQSGRTLIENGIDIDTQDLESVIDGLREIENSYYKIMLNADEKNTFDVEGLKETVEKVNELKFMPAQVLSNTFEIRKSITLDKMYDTGKRYEKENKAFINKIETSYETVMTTPRKDMGDDIHKAFRNVNDMLDEIGMEKTKLNQRAVRILGYNSIEITKENVEQMKLYDAKVTELITNLTPNVAVELIRNKVNPLDVPIDDLNKILISIKENDDKENEENYSKFLWELEHKGGITKEERESYIGMYRLVNAIKKSDGAVIGATVNAGREMTLSNLLTSIRTNNMINGKQHGINVEINDDFGNIQDLFKDQNAIDKQISSSYKMQNSENISEGIIDNTVKQNQNEYIDSIKADNDTLIETSSIVIRNISKNISPQAIDILKEQGFDILNMSVEKVMDLLSDYQQENMKEQNKKYYQQKVNEVRNIVDKNVSLVKVLENANMQMTISNLLSSADMLNGNGILSATKNMLKKSKEKEKEILKKIDNTILHMDDKDSMGEYYGQMTEVLSLYINDEKKEVITNDSLKELIRAGQNINFAYNLSQKECYDIPLVVGDEVTNVHLTIIDKKKDNNSISIRYMSEVYGEVNAEFTVKNNKLNGWMITQDNDWTNILNSKEHEIKEQIQNIGVEVGHITYGVHSNINYDYKFNNNEKTNINNKKLYSISKVLITNIRDSQKQLQYEEEKRNIV